MGLKNLTAVEALRLYCDAALFKLFYEPPEIQVIVWSIRMRYPDACLRDLYHVFFTCRHLAQAMTGFLVSALC